MISRMEKAYQKSYICKFMVDVKIAIEIVAYFCRTFLQYVKVKPTLLQQERSVQLVSLKAPGGTLLPVGNSDICHCL